MNHEALNRYIAAKGYLEATKMIQTSSHNTGARIVMTILPMHMLGGFSIELFLKAWLLQAGVPSNDVRRFGHDLSRLFTTAQQSGLPTIAFLDDVLALFAEPHADFTYRYLETADTIQVANWPNVFGVLDRLDVVVDAFVGASASRGLQPGH